MVLLLIFLYSRFFLKAFYVRSRFHYLCFSNLTFRLESLLIIGYKKKFLKIIIGNLKGRPFKTLFFHDILCIMGQKLFRYPLTMTKTGYEEISNLFFACPYISFLLQVFVMVMQVQNNLCTPKSGEILVASTQDFLTSSFLITRKDTFYDRASFSLICSYMGDGMDPIDLPTPALIKVGNFERVCELLLLLAA